MKNDFIKSKNNVVEPKNNGSFINIIAVWLIIIVSVCSVLGCVFSALNYFKSDIKTASADETSFYYTSSRYMSMTGYLQSVPPSSVSYDMVFWDFLNSYSTNYSTMVFNFAGIGTADIGFYSNFNAVTPRFNYSNRVYFLTSDGTKLIYPYTGNIPLVSLRTTSADKLIDSVHDNNTFSSMVINWFASTQAITYGQSAFYSYYGISVVDGFNFNIVSLRTFTNYFVLPENYMPNYTSLRLCVNVFRYADNVGRYLDIYVPMLVYYASTTNINNAYFAFIDTTIYFTNPNNSYSDGYSAGYSNGYSAGDNDGYSAGQADGYTSGYNNGYSEGKTVGYNNGVNDTHQYTFFNLISAVIDAPVQAFVGLFNFNLLGVNLFSFFTGLLTLALIIFIIRLILGG